jgi:hypothetical protein
VAAHVLQVQADEVLVVTILMAGLHLLSGHFFTFRKRAMRASSKGGFTLLYRPNDDGGRAP